MHRLAIIIATAGTLAFAASLHAQNADTAGSTIPDKQRPPAGMCRIWLDGVPADQQPAPTDCATAIRHRPPKGHVVFGEPVQAPKIERRTPPTIDRHALPQIERFAPPSKDRTPRVDTPRVDSSQRPQPPQTRQARPIHRDTSGFVRPHTRRVMRLEHH